MKKQRLKVFSKNGIYLGDREETILDRYGGLILIGILLIFIVLGTICINFSVNKIGLPDIELTTNVVTH